MLVEHPEDMAEIEKKIEAEEAAKRSKRKRVIIFIIGLVGFTASIVLTSVFISSYFKNLNQSTGTPTAQVNAHASVAIDKSKQTMKRDGSYWEFHAEGTVKNDGNVDLAYVMVTVDLFDENGIKIDYALSNTGRLNVGQTAYWSVDPYLEKKPATYSVSLDWFRQY